jgi:hypothetical protein
LPASQLAKQHLISGSSLRWTSCTAPIAEAVKGTMSNISAKAYLGHL